MVDRSPVGNPDSFGPGAPPADPAAQLSRRSRALCIGSLIIYLIWLVLLGGLAWQTRS